jgi:hypothetical protein
MISKRKTVVPGQGCTARSPTTGVFRRARHPGGQQKKMKNEEEDDKQKKDGGTFSGVYGALANHRGVSARSPPRIVQR